MFMIKPLKEAIEESYTKIRELEIAQLYASCYKTAWETTLSLEEDGKSYVFTGDIHAMWLRDSAMQLLPYLSMADIDVVARALRGVVLQQAHFIQIDPYANAFNRKPDGSCFCADHTQMSPWVWERKYEVDSLAFFLFFLEAYFRRTKDRTVFTETVVGAVQTILEVWRTEQKHAEFSPYRFERDSPLKTETLSNGGQGTLVGYTGMTWSGFRPSDDACELHYLIPANMLAVSVLNSLQELPLPDAILKSAKSLSREIDSGIQKFGVIEHPKYGRIFAYEVDGLGNYTLMDDANLPSLLGAPWYGYCQPEDEIYKNTRRFLLSENNPYYFTGKFGAGIGSQHTRKGYIWPIALAVQGLTSTSLDEKKEILSMLFNTTAGTYHMHESFEANDPTHFTRAWFAWADSMFCLLVQQIYKL